MEFACPFSVRLLFRELWRWARLARRGRLAVWRERVLGFGGATADDIDAIVVLSARVQDWLNAAGSAQQIGPVPRELTAAHVAAGTVRALTEHGSLIGSLFLEPVGDGSVTPAIAERLARWGVATNGPPLWFLQKFMIDPGRHGRGLGGELLQDALRVAVMNSGEARVALDCWAGNAKLRAYYTAAGFRLNGVVPLHDYQVAVFVWDSTTRPLTPSRPRVSSSYGDTIPSGAVDPSTPVQPPGSR